MREIELTNDDAPGAPGAGTGSHPDTRPLPGSVAPPGRPAGGGRDLGGFVVEWELDHPLGSRR